VKRAGICNFQKRRPAPRQGGFHVTQSSVAVKNRLLIEELHGKRVKAGETFGAAYVIGWFDDIPAMQAVYDRYKGKHAIVVAKGGFRLE
jgi:hypothetical protein